MKHFLNALLLFLVLTALLFAFLHTAVAYGDTLALSHRYCDTHAYHALRLTLPSLFQKAKEGAHALWDALPPGVTLLPALVWENGTLLLMGVKQAYTEELVGCTLLP